MPKRKGAEKFHSKRGSEHLFFSVGSGIGYLFNVGGGQTAHGPRASFMAGNWLTPSWDYGPEGNIHNGNREIRICIWQEPM